MEEISPKQWLILIILTALIAFGAGNIYGAKKFGTRADETGIKVENPVQSNMQAGSLPDTQTSKITVYVTGAVNKPDVYNLPSGSIVKDAILKAGGATKNADLIAINLAKKVEDGEEIIVPKKSSAGTENAQAETGRSSNKNSGKININTASLSELETLPGIGEVKANAIVQYRKEHGSFKTIHEITRVSGIGEKTFEKIKDLITVG